MPTVTEEPLDGGVRFVVETAAGRSALDYVWGGSAVPAGGRSRLATAAVALVPLALRTGEPLELDGAVEEPLVDSLQEWADAWAFIRPDIFRSARITATGAGHGAATPAERRSAAIAFSGGVDSFYATLTHLASAPEPDPVLVLVHGFDIALDERKGFDVAVDRAQAAADALGLPLAWVRTNWRADFSTHWTMEFACGLASVLHLWRDDARRAVIGSDEGSGYSFEVFPWSSNPATNPLLGSSSFPLETLGFAADRVDKCAVVARVPELLHTLRVCLREDAAGLNCGTCEKCLRTKLCFAAGGCRTVPALGDCSLAALDDLRLHKPHLLQYFRAVLDHRPNEIDENERRATLRMIRRESLRFRTAPARRPLRTARTLVRRVTARGVAARA